MKIGEYDGYEWFYRSEMDYSSINPCGAIFNVTGEFCLQR